MLLCRLHCIVHAQIASLMQGLRLDLQSLRYSQILPRPRSKLNLGDITPFRHNMATGAPAASTGAVYPDQYNEQLQEKVRRVQELFSDQKLPEIEVFRSSAQHFRMRAEFRVWLDGEDLYYVMFEKQDNNGNVIAEASAESDGAKPAEPKAAASGTHEAATDTADAPATSQTAAAAEPAAAAGGSSKQLPAKARRQHQQRVKRRRSTAAFSRVRISEFPVASQLICELMPLLRKELLSHPVLREKLFQANFHTTLSKQAMITLAYHKNLDDMWQQAAKALQSKLLQALRPDSCSALHIIGRSRKQKIALDADSVVERMDVGERTYEYMQVEGAFSQPNGGVCKQMLSWAVDVTKGSSGDLLELYCGNGNFTIPLAQNFKQVVATEVAKASVAAARHNIATNNIKNIFLARMSSEEFTDTWKVKGSRNRLAGLDWEQLELQTLFVDPPRAGLDPETEQLLQDFKQVVYISCNPETLAKNLKSVRDTHDIVRFAVFDQFPYTHHLECGAFLVNKVQ